MITAGIGTPHVLQASIPQWQQFGPVHWMAICSAAACCFAIVYFRAELRRFRPDRVLALAMLVVYIAWLTYCLTTGYKTPAELLPLYTCDATIFLAVAWSWWKPPWLGQVIFLWAAIGGVVTILMPDTDGYTFPSFIAVQPLLSHTIMLMFALEIVTIERIRPTWSAYIRTGIASLVLVPLSLWANAHFGTDYMFVSNNPGGIFSFLDAYSGAARVAMTVVAGAALLFIALVAWFVLEIPLRRQDRMATTLHHASAVA